MSYNFSSFNVFFWPFPFGPLFIKIFDVCSYVFTCVEFVSCSASTETLDRYEIFFYVSNFQMSARHDILAYLTYPGSITTPLSKHTISSFFSLKLKVHMHTELYSLTYGKVPFPYEFCHK